MMMAKDGEVALLFQPLLGLAANFSGAHKSQVADPMIEAGTFDLSDELHSRQQVVLHR